MHGITRASRAGMWNGTPGRGLRGRVSTWCLILAAVSIGAAPASSATNYIVVDLGTLYGIYSWGTDISEEGRIAGTSTAPPNGAVHAFLWEDGEVADLGTPEGYQVSRATGLNDAGQLIATTEGEVQGEFAYLWEGGVWQALGTLPGLPHARPSDIDHEGRIAGYSYLLGGGGSMAWLWEDGSFTALGDLIGEGSRAFALNANLQIVGSSDAAPGEAYHPHAFIWQNGEMTDLGVLPGQEDSSARDVNDLGQVCGSSSHVQPTYPFQTFGRACIWDDGQILDIGTDGFRISVATGINNHAQVVGTATSHVLSRAFIWEEGVLTFLDTLVPADSGWQLEGASAINDAGWIVGTGTAPDGERHGFLLLPAGTVSAESLEVGELGGLLLRSAPNPFRDRTAVSYDVPQAGAIRIDLIDPTGRRIATLAEGFHPAGKHTRVWSGRDATGSPVQSGVYWVRFTTADGVSAGKRLTLLR